MKYNSADSLAWNKVNQDLDNLDDGIFYGLEEIDNVAVEKSNGSLEFVPKEPKKEPKVEHTKSKSKEKTKKPQKATPATDFSPLMALPTTSKPQLQSLNDWPELSPALFTALSELGFPNPTKIQLESIPLALQGRDLIGKAATGSGKTLAFGLPIIERYLESPDKKVPAGLIIAPTRELAHQIKDHMQAVIDKCDLDDTCGVVALTGGLAIQKQVRLLSRNPVAIVGTPGRLLEILEQLPKDQLEKWQTIGTLVLDEADRLVQNNSFEELDSILNKLGRAKRQTMVFSATFDSEYWTKLDRKSRKKLDIREVLQSRLTMHKNSAFIDADPEETVATNVVQSIIECPGKEKDLYLYYFTLVYPGKTIVFVNSIDAVKRILPLLRELNMAAYAVYSEMIQKQRLRSIEQFKATPNSILIATDVAARGLDIPLVDHVVHYNLPRSADMYVHRSGRTARAGHEGVSVMLCSPEEASKALIKLCKLIKIHPKEFEIDFAVLDRLRERVKLAKQIADANATSARSGKKMAWIDQAAEEFGIDLSDDERAALHEVKSKRENVDVRGMRAELKSLLERKISPNRKYLTSGTTNLAHEMLKNPTAIVAGKAAVSAIESLQGKRKRPGQENVNEPSKKVKPEPAQPKKSAKEKRGKQSKGTNDGTKKNSTKNNGAKKPQRKQRAEGSQFRKGKSLSLKNMETVNDAKDDS